MEPARYEPSRATNAVARRHNTSLSCSGERAGAMETGAPPTPSGIRQVADLHAALPR
jgi:hypothetical protein